jgi:hypothetical protein
MPIDQKVDDCGANASGKDDIDPSPDYALAPNGPFLRLSVRRSLLSWAGLLPTWRRSIQVLAHRRALYPKS